MEQKFRGRAKTSDPLEAAEIDARDLQAIRKLRAGTADSADQHVFVQWLLRATGVHDLAYQPNDRLTCVALGKQWVGNQFLAASQSAIVERE